jgi:hypothetical protein
MEPLARQLGFNFDIETLRPGVSREQIAFALLGCGADLLSGLRYPDAVPTEDRQLAKQLAQTVHKQFAHDEGRHAASFLAQACGIWLHEIMLLHDDPLSAEINLSLVGILDDISPLADVDRAALGEARAEYRVIHTRETGGRFHATGWYMAQADAEFAEGRDPHSDPELLGSQRRYASQYLRLKSEVHAIGICAGSATGATELFNEYSTSFAVLEHDSGSMSWWTHCAESWNHAGQLFYANHVERARSLPSQLADASAETLRRRAQDILDTPPGGIPDAAKEASSSLAYEIGPGKVDWNLALDAIVMGYCVREAEVQLLDYNDFDHDYAEKLRDWAEREPSLAVAAGALSVHDSLPEPFAASVDEWEQIKSWFVTEALNRSWGRHRLEIEEGDGPTLSEAEVERAFSLGYGLAFSQGQALGSTRDYAST